MHLSHFTRSLAIGLPLMSAAQSLSSSHLLSSLQYAASCPATSDQGAFRDLLQFACSVQSFLTTLGGIVFIIGVIIAGMMRMMSFGSDRRVAISNMALTAAVVGLVIMLLANPLSTLLQGAFK